MTIFAAVRAVKITSMNGLVKINNHALRLDETSRQRVRPGAKVGECLSSSIAPDSDPRNVIEAFKTFKKETGVKERKGAPLGLHLMCIVSPEWISEAGDLHDRENPRNAQLMKAASEWVETWAGQNSLINVRLDLDEVGGGVVDLIVSPMRESRGKPVISTSKALKELREKHGDKREYASLQTDWAEFAKKHLDQRIERGTPVAETEREHVNADIFKEYAEKALKDEKEELQLREYELKAQKRAEEKLAQKNAQDAKHNAELTERLNLRQTELSEREAKLEDGEKTLKRRAEIVERTMKEAAKIKFDAFEKEQEVKKFEISVNEKAAENEVAISFFRSIKSLGKHTGVSITSRLMSYFREIPFEKYQPQYKENAANFFGRLTGITRLLDEANGHKFKDRPQSINKGKEGR